MYHMVEFEEARIMVPIFGKSLLLNTDTSVAVFGPSENALTAAMTQLPNERKRLQLKYASELLQGRLKSTSDPV